MGLILIKPGVLGGAFIAQMDIKTVTDSLSNMMRLGKIRISDIWEFRLLIEPNISRLAAERRTDWDLQQMEEMNVGREKAVKARKIPVVSNIDFHQAIAKATKNPLAILILDTLAEALIEEFKRLNFSLSDHQSIIHFHREILEHIKKRKSQQVAGVMEAHLLDVKKRLKI